MAYKDPKNTVRYVRNKRRLRIEGARAICGDKCHDCDYSEYPEVLEFHHVVPRKISGRKSLESLRDKPWEVLRTEVLEHCVLLCPTCHKERHLLDEHDSLKFSYQMEEIL